MADYKQYLWQDPEQYVWNSQALNISDNKDFLTFLHLEMKTHDFWSTASIT